MRPVLRTAIAILAPAALVVAATPPGLASTGARPDLADLALEKVANRSTVAAGQNIVYTVTLTNRGPDTAWNIVFGDALPDALKLVDADCISSQWTSAAFCRVPRLEKGETASLILVTAVPDVAPDEEWIKNMAYIVEDATPDPERVNNTASVTVRFVR